MRRSSTPGIGFGLGLERLLLLVESQGIEIPVPVYMDVYIASIGKEESQKQSDKSIC